MDQVYRPGYGHLAAALGPCWPAHDLCLYALDIASGLWSVLYLQSSRDTALLSAQAEYQARILPALAARLMTETTRCGHTRPPEHAMTDDSTLRQALAYARRGWPVFPCLEGQKVPATRHGFRDATTDEQQITGWFGRNPHLNVAIATGAPGPDVLDVDVHGAAGNGYAALGRLHCAGLLEDAYGYVRTPSGGLHIYFTGTTQRNGHLAAHHVDFRSAGGYVLTPPSQVDGHLYLSWGTPGRDGMLSWERVRRALPSQPQRQRSGPRPAQDRDLGTLAQWLARQPEGNRNAGLYWAANRALEADPAADLSPLADAARQSGLGDQEINRTLDSARRTGQARSEPPDYQAEAVS